MSNQCDHGHLRRVCEICQRDDEIEQLKAERDALLVDAERYRWLRDNVYAGVNRHNECLWTIRGLYEKDGQSFDAAIDAARGEKNG